MSAADLRDAWEVADAHKEVLVAVAAERDRLREEVAYWRRDAAARCFSAACAYRAAMEKSESERATQIYISEIQPTLAAIDDADASNWHENCEGCGKPLLNGQLVHYYEDAASIHVDCDNPASAKPDEHSHPYDDAFCPEHMAQMIQMARDIER